MIQSLTSQPASMLAGLLSGFSAKDRQGETEKGTAAGRQASAARNRAAGNVEGPGTVNSTAGGRAAATPDGVPPLVAQAFPDFAELALGIVDRAGMGTAAGGAQAQTESELFSQITGILGPATGPGSLSDRITSARTALAAWGQAPEDASARAAALGAVNGVLEQTGAGIRGLTRMIPEIDARIARETQLIQAGLKRLNQANEAVVAAKAAGTNPTGPQAERKAALADLSTYVQLKFQDRPDGALIPVSADGVPLPDDLGEVTAEELRGGLTGGRLKALVDLRDRTLPDLLRQARSIAAGLTGRLNDAASAPPAAVLCGTDTGLGPNDRLAISGSAGFALVDAQGLVQSAVTIDFNSRTRRALGVPPSGVAVGTPLQLVKTINESFKGSASLSFTGGVFQFASLSDKFRVAVVTQDRAGSARNFVQTTGLGRIVDGPVAEGVATGLLPTDAHGFAEGQSLTLSLEAPGGQSLKARIVVAGHTVQDLLDCINDRETGLGSAQFLSLDKDGSLMKAFAKDWLGARLSVIDDQTRRLDTSRGFGAVFALDLPAAPRAAAGVSISELGAARAIIDDKTRRGSPLVRAQDTATIAKLGAALEAEVIVPASLGRATRVLSLSNIAGEFAAGAAEMAAAAARRMQDARAFGLALNDERRRLSSASFGAELQHLSALQTARNVDGRLDAVSTGLLAHLDRALAARDTARADMVTAPAALAA